MHDVEWLFYGHNDDGTPALLRARGIGLAIAAGVTLGSIMIRPLRRLAATPSTR